MTRLETAAITAARDLGAEHVWARQNPISQVLRVGTEPELSLTSAQGKAIVRACDATDLRRFVHEDWAVWSGTAREGEVIVHTRPVVSR